MKKDHGVGYVKKSLIFFLFLLTALILAGVGQASTITLCTQCHGMPPLDNTTRNAATGAFQGNHQTHLPASALQASCVKCHQNLTNNVSTYDVKHASTGSYKIQIANNVNTSPATGQYNVSGSPITFKNQTTVPVLGSCSTVNCHFENLTDVWGVPAASTYSTLGATAATCAKCHGAPPVGTSPSFTGGAAGSHGKHDTYFKGFAQCIKCHSDHTAEANKFAHATSAGRRNLVVQLRDPSNASSGSYTGAPLNDYLPSQATVFGTCNTNYCHSNGLAVPSYTAPVWGSAATGACGTCHGANATTVPASVPHAKHVGSTAVYRYSCAKCHAATVKDTVDSTVFAAISSYNLHVNKSRDVNFNAYNPGASYNGTNCNNAYCHSIGNTNVAASKLPPAYGGSLYNTPTWSGSVSCNSCHGRSNAQGFPDYTSASAGSSTANSHYRHVAFKGVGCVECHYKTTKNGTSIRSDIIPSLHVNAATNDVFFNLSSNNKSGTYAFGSKTCSSTYCHSNGNSGPAVKPAQWGDKMPADCTGCHGNDYLSASPIVTGKHRAHLYNYTTLGRNNYFNCVDCHAKTVSGNRTIANQANHVNALKDYSGVRAGKIATANSGKCNNVYCHSIGTKTNQFWNMTSANWYSARTFTTCNGCHGGPKLPNGTVAAFSSLSSQGAPNYSNTTAPNSHYRHVPGAGMTSTTGCAKCHYRTVDSVIPNKLRNYSTLHLNGTRNVNFSVSASLSGLQGRYSSTTQQCMNTYCHGAPKTPSWGSPSLLCNQCHSADSTGFGIIAGSTTTGAHGAHYQVATPPASGTYASMPPGEGSAATATLYQYNCTSCHTSPAQHANGIADPTSGAAGQVYFGYSTTGKSGTYKYAATAQATTDNGFKWTAGKCSNTYCHSNGNGTFGNNTSFTWNSAKGTLRCIGCHGNNAASASPIATGKHADHINPSNPGSLLGTGNGFACAQCHAKTVFGNDTTVSNKLNHVNKFKDYSGAYAPRSGYSVVQAKSCTTTYCHSNGNPGAIAFVSMTGSKTWSGSLSNMGCNGCHGRSNPTTGAPDYANGYPGNPNAANSHPKHISVLGINDTTGCAKCHAKTVNAGVANKFRSYSTLHLNGTPNVIMQPAYGGTFSANVCSNVSCHSNGKGTYQNPTWGQTDDCGFCHAINKLSRGHAFHVYTSVSNTPTLYNYTANRSGLVSGAQRYNFGCAVCHPVNNPSHATGTVYFNFSPSEANTGSLKKKNNGTIANANVQAGAVNSGTSGTSVPGSLVRCINLYCHSNGMTGSSFKAYTTPEWYAGNFTGDRCAACHGNSPNTGGKLGSAAHVAHVKSIHNDDVYSGTAGLLPASGAVLVNAGHGDPAQATTINCNLCHYNTVTSRRNDQNTQCVTCHYSGNTVGAAFGNNAAIANKAFHVNGKADVVFQNISARSKAQLRAGSYANYTAAGGFWTRTTYKADVGSYDKAKQPLTSGTYSVGLAGNCANFACHNSDANMTPVNWFNDVGKAAQCTLCHRDL